jgi:hypothetical protein
MAASTMEFERQSNNAPAPQRQTALPSREEPALERVAIIARLKEGCERRAAELVGAGPPFDLTNTGVVRHSIYGQPRVARERFGWELDDGKPIATAAGERSESWA